MNITILTIFPDLFQSFLSSHIVKRAGTLGKASVRIVDVRSYTAGSFRAVSDSPLGGGRGLLLRAEPVYRALLDVLTPGNAEEVPEEVPEEGPEEGPGGDPDCGKWDREGFPSLPPHDPSVRIVFLTPEGRTYRQETARRYAALSHLILVCGHFEGFDARILPFADELLSVGDYILTGGELPAMLTADSVLRLLPGCLRDGSAGEESFEQGLLEYPQYTQPAVWRGIAAPEVLLSGDHGKIRAFRQEEAERRTRELRPDLFRS